MRVLLAHDGSESAEQACALVAGLEWPAGSELVVVSAFQPYLPGIGMPGEILDPGTADLIFEEERARAEAIARDGGVRAANSSSTIAWEVGEGRPADVILEAAREHASDLLVVGSRGLGPFQSALLGSVSAELVDHASCPVLVARGTSIGRVILADDGSAAASAAAALLVDWPIFADSTIRVVSVAELDDHLLDRIAGVAHLGGEAARIVSEKAVEATIVRAQQTAGRLQAAGRQVEVDVRRGDPAERVVQAATEWPADLVVLGSRGHSGVEHLHLGSVGRRVMHHVPCSALVAHAPADGGFRGGGMRSPRGRRDLGLGAC
jgi:nucleotide-binding universal stress UspA family protein